MKILLLFIKKWIIYFFNNKLIVKFLYLLKLFFDYVLIINDFILFKITNLKIRTKCTKLLDKKKFSLFIIKLKKNDFINIFLFNLFKLFVKILKIFINFLGFITYAIWSYLNTILLYALGYILLEFGATRIYDPNQDITSREIWEVISKKLSILKKKYFSKKYFSESSFIFYKIIIEKVSIVYYCIVSTRLFIYNNFFFKFKNDIFKLNLYTYGSTLFILYIINNVLFFKKIFYFKKFKIKSNLFFYNFKKYVYLNYLKFFINLFKKNKLFFLNKKFFEKSIILNLVNYNTILNFKTFLKIKNKLKQKMLFMKNIFQFNRFKNYFGYRIKFWSTQKRFLHFYIKLLKKSKKIKMGALRVIYIQEWWIYKFYLKNYYFNSFLKIIFIFCNFVKNKIIFMFFYLNFIIDFIL